MTPHPFLSPHARSPLHRPPSARALGNQVLYELRMMMAITSTSPSGLFLVTQLSCAKRSEHTAGGRSQGGLGGEEPDERRVDLAGQGRSRRTRVSPEITAASMLLLEKRR